jgi:hypothetical protein
MEGKDVYILLAFALLRRRRPASPHRRSLCRFTGDHPAHHVDDALLGLTPEHGHFFNRKLPGALALDMAAFILATKNVSIALLTHVVPSYDTSSVW